MKLPAEIHLLKHVIVPLASLTITGMCMGQNVGIGTNTPTGPLTFNASAGNKIVLSGDGNTSHFGIGFQTGQLQMYTASANDVILFGSGRSSAFSERMRVINNGSDGINLSGRMVMKNGTSPLDANYGAGVWLYKADNSGPLGFMGTQNNQNLGFYGGSAGWGFVYDAVNSRVGIGGNSSPNAPLAFPATLGKKITLYPGATGDVGIGVSGNRLYLYSDNSNADVAFGYDAAGVFNERFAVKPNGALAVVGNTGQPGQVITSAGSGSAATWANLPGFANIARQSVASPVLEGNFADYDLPGVTANISVTANTRVVFQFSLSFGNIGCFGCGDNLVKGVLKKVVGGVTSDVSEKKFFIPNGAESDFDSGPIVVDIQPGDYSFKVALRSNGNSTKILDYAYSSHLVWQVYPL